MTGFVTTWTRGALSRYESMSSLAARYCEANVIDGAAFASLIGVCLKSNACEDAVDRTVGWPICTVDAQDFNVLTLSRILNEPPSIIRTMSHRAFRLGRMGFVEYDDRSREERFAELWGCPECLRAGYHSVLHQVAWIKRCFMHGCPLICLDESVRPTRHLMSADTRCMSALHDVWFGPKARFRISGVPPFDREGLVIPARALAIAAEMGRTCQRIMTLSGEDEDVSRVRDASSLRRVLLCATDMAGVRLPRRIVGKERPGFRSRRLFVPLDAQEVLLLRDGDDVITRQWERHCAARVMQCIWEGEFPSWRIVGVDIFRRMTEGHEECIRKTRDALAVGLNSWRNLVKDQPEELTFAEAVRARRMLPCQRSLSASLWTRRYLVGRHGYYWEAAWPYSQMPKLVAEEWGNNWPNEVAGRLFKSARPPPRQDRDSGEWIRAERVEDIVLDSYIPQSVRRVRPSVVAPRGALATLVDELLLERQWAAAWALYDCESKVTVDIRFAGSALEGFRAALDKRAPPYAVRIVDGGVILRMWPQSPREHPPWNSAGVASGKHARQTEQLWENVFRAIEESDARFHNAISVASAA